MTRTPSDHPAPRPGAGTAHSGGSAQSGPGQSGSSGRPVPSPLTVAAGVRPHPPTTTHAAQPHPPAPAAHPTPAHAAPSPSAGEPVSGAQSLVRSLEALGVDVVFGIPGGAILPAYDPLSDSRLRHVLVRHEQGAGHAATGYAQATGRVGVCMATSGPGATNLVTPIADAYMDSVAMVAITGQVPSGSIGSDAFQEADIHGITLPITKHNYLVQSADQLPRILAEAFHLASTGRPGPVLVDIPKDVLTARTTFSWPPVMELPGYRPTLAPHGKQIREAARLIAMARRPVLYVGGGVTKAGASPALLRLAELSGAPVVTTLMALGAFPNSHRQHLGMPGMHGRVVAVAALQQADLIVALGARFDDRVTGRLETFAPGAAIVHADIDPAEIGKNRTADVPIVGDARHVIEDLTAALAGEHRAGHRADLTDWWSTLDDLRQRYPLGWEAQPDGGLAPQYVIRRLGELVGPDAVYVAGVGQHQMWAAQFISYEQPRTWLSSGGLGTMGYAVPAAMGAKVGQPGRVVWAVDGDGCFQMTNQELATCALEQIPIKVAIINNGNLGMVREVYARVAGESTADPVGRTSGADPVGRASGADPVGRASGADPGGRRRIPDFVALAEALGCVGLRCEAEADVDATIAEAMAVTDAPVVVDFVVGKDPMVWPMVGPGVSQEDLAAARAQRPVFEDDDL
jgi:acetolactate synthase I/II/III large subunit